MPPARPIPLLCCALLLAVLPFHAPPLAAQARGVVSGRVVDAAAGQPLAGVSVSVDGTGIGALSDARGAFVLRDVPAGTRTVRAARLGLRPASTVVQVGAAPVELTLRLEADPLGLDEIVVVGYGEERRRDIAGAVASLRAGEVVETTPTPTVNALLQGRLAGVHVSHNSGQPGAAPTVRVRGAASVSAGNRPLYVVDGVPVVQGNLSQTDGTFGGQGIDALSDLNPGDIERVEVLKDASAAAIYGSRASNGVVLITTRRGGAGAGEVGFHTYYGMQRLWRRPSLLNAQQFREVYDESLAEIGLFADAFWPVAVPIFDVDVDWVDAVTAPAPIAGHEAWARGGGERVRYYVSGAAFLQDGVVGGFAHRRLSGRINLDYQPAERLTLGTNVALSRGVVERGRGDNTIYGPFANAIAQPPTEAIFDPAGGYNFDTWYPNPVALMRENDAEERSVRALGSAFARLHLTDGAALRLSAGFDQYMLRSRLYDSPVIGVFQGEGRGIAAQTNTSNATAEATLDFARDLAPGHALSGVVGAGAERAATELASLQGIGFPGEQYRYVDAAAVIAGAGNSVSEWTMLSLFGRLTYGIGERLSAALNLRADGSSRFGANHRYGTFPSVSLLWRPLPRAEALALRASYGRTGNQQGIGDLAALGLFAGGANYGDQAGIAPLQLPNPDLRWETTDQLNLGGDVALLGERLGLSLDVYIKDTHDLLLSRPLPRTSGFDVVTQNVGSMTNRGVELTARLQALRPRRAGALAWDVQLNLAHNANQVTALLDDEPIFIGLENSVLIFAGRPLGVFYGYVMDGIFQTQAEVEAHAFQSEWTAPGDVRFRDVNGDGVVDAADRTVIGSPWPRLEGGLSNALGWRGFDASALLQFSYGNDVLNAMRLFTDAYGRGGDNHSTRALRRWRPDRPSHTEPRATWLDDNDNARLSSRFVEDGSYLRLKSLAVGYTLPAAASARLGVRSARLYLSGSNLLTWTRYSGFDPEVNYAGDAAVTRGVDFYTQPQLRTLSAGLNLGL